MSSRLATTINRGVAWTAASQTIVAVSDMVSQLVVVSRWLTEAQLGIAMMAVPLYSVLDAAADLGVTSALIQRDDHTPERVSTVFWFNLLLSFGLFLALLVLGPLYGRLQGYDVVGWLLIAYGGKLVVQNVYAIPYALLRKQLDFAEIAKIRTIAFLVESITRIGFAAYGVTVWCFTLAALAKFVVFAVLMQARHPFIPKLVFRWKEIAPYVRFGLRSAASQILYYLYTNLDYVVVSYFFGAAANGVYALAYWIVLEAVKTVANVVIDVAFPTFARLAADRPALLAQFIRLTRLDMIAVLPLVIVIVLVVPDFLTVFYGGGQWSPAQLATCATAARILCIVGVLRSVGFIGPPLLDGIGRPELTLRYMVLATIAVPAAFVAGAVLLGDRLGLLSVAVAWAVGYPLAFAALIAVIAAAVGLKIGEYVRGTASIAACAVVGLAGGWGVLQAASGLTPGLRMIVVGGSALVAMFAMLAWWQKVTPRAIVASLRG